MCVCVCQCVCVFLWHARMYARTHAGRQAGRQATNNTYMHISNITHICHIIRMLPLIWPPFCQKAKQKPGPQPQAVHIWLHLVAVCLVQLIRAQENNTRHLYTLGSSNRLSPAPPKYWPWAKRAVCVTLSPPTPAPIDASLPFSQMQAGCSSAFLPWLDGWRCISKQVWASIKPILESTTTYMNVMQNSCFLFMHPHFV